MESSLKDCLLILNNKLKLWHNTYYDAGLDAKIAADIGNESMAAVASKRMKEALKVIGWLEKEVSKVEGGEQLCGNG